MQTLIYCCISEVDHVTITRSFYALRSLHTGSTISYFTVDWLQGNIQFFLELVIFIFDVFSAKGVNSFQAEIKCSYQQIISAKF